MHALLHVMTLSAVLWGPNPPAAPPSIVLEARAEVSGAVLRLSDLAHVASGALWGQLPLGAAPAPGATRIVTRAEVAVALRAQGFAIPLSGAPRVRVTRRGARVPQVRGEILLSGRYLERVAARFVRRSLELDPSAPLTLRSELPQRWRVPRTPGGRIHARWVAGPPKPGDLARVALEVRVESRALATLELSFERPAPKPTPAAAPTRKRWPQRVERRPQRAPRGSSGRAKTSSKDPVSEAPELVKRGSHVTVLVKSGALTITAEGVAEKGGARGQSVPVRLGKDRPLVVGRIVDRGRVVVELRPREGE